MMVLVVLPKRVHGCFNATPTHGSRLVQHSLLIALHMHNDRNSHKRGRQRAVPAYKTHPQLLIFAAVKKSAPYTRVFTVCQN